MSAALPLYACLAFLFTSFRLFLVSPFYSYFRFFLGESRPSGLRRRAITIRPNTLSLNSVYATSYTVRHMTLRFSLNLRTHVWTIKCQTKTFRLPSSPPFCLLFFPLVTTGRPLSRLPKWKWAGKVRKQYERKWEIGPVNDKERTTYSMARGRCTSPLHRLSIEQCF